MKKPKEETFRRAIKKALEMKEITVQECERLLNAEGREIEILINTADQLRNICVGDVVTYVINRNINFTNICKNSCKFCAFRREKYDPNAYILSKAEVREKTKEAVEKGATEICLQGGINPSLTLDDYINYLKAIREASSNVHIHAFSPEEIEYASRESGKGVKSVLRSLKEVGLNSIPGTAAEILVNRVRNIICPQKISSEKWKEIIKTAHSLDIPSTATMMYGHIESNRDIAVHLKKIREIQKETNGFTEFVPLGFARRNTELEGNRKLKNLSETDHIKIHSVSRLMLAGSIDNIQTSWVKLGPDLARKTLNSGANDFSGTLMEENITRSAGGQIEYLKPERIEEMIQMEKKIPKERTTLYDKAGKT
ncbi:MAG: 7,8-didemethyl-8-hydroxy-5-deazariboflavin synthase subunit CofH [Candidatus Hadarchaeia archaeon]